MLEIEATELGQDGSVELKVGGKKLRFVRESDLGAIKSAKEKMEEELEKLRTNLSTRTTEANEKHQELLKAQAIIEQSASLTTERDQLKASLEEMQSKVATLEESSGKTTQELAEMYRRELVTNYKVNADKIKDAPLETLRGHRATLSLLDTSSAPANYDGAGVAGGAPTSLTGKSPLQLATLGYEQSKAK